MSEQWLMIQNPGEVPLWGIRLLGLSEKEESQIGRFGSGLKEAICLLTRLNIPLVICSGETRVEFSTQNLGGHDEIGFTLNQDVDGYEAGKWHGLGLHPNFGRHDWTDPWQALREIVCNAIDEGLDMMHRGVVAEIEPKAGCTRAYIGNQPSIRNAYNSLNDRILQLGDHTPAQSYSKGNIYNRIGLGPGAQIYHKGIWVCGNGQKSIYDYDFPELKITESRTSAASDVNRQMTIALEHMNATLLTPIVRIMSTSSFEKNDFFDYAEAHVGWSSIHWELTTNPSRGAPWKEAFHRVHGEGAIACSSDMAMLKRVADAGLTPIPLTETIHNVFKAAGVRTHEDVLNRDDLEGIEIIRGGQHSELCKRADRVWNALAEVGAVMGERPSLLIFREPPACEVSRLGFERDGMVYINVNVLGSRNERLALIEEFGHASTGAGDETRAFQMWFLDVIDKALFSTKHLSELP